MGVWISSHLLFAVKAYFIAHIFFFSCVFCAHLDGVWRTQIGISHVLLLSSQRIAPPKTATNSYWIIEIFGSHLFILSQPHRVLSHSALHTTSYTASRSSYHRPIRHVPTDIDIWRHCIIVLSACRRHRWNPNKIINSMCFRLWIIQAQRRGASEQSCLYRQSLCTKYICICM